jgi:hypothetical protein
MSVPAFLSLRFNRVFDIAIGLFHLAFESISASFLAWIVGCVAYPLLQLAFQLIDFAGDLFFSMANVPLEHMDHTTRKPLRGQPDISASTTVLLGFRRLSNTLPSFGLVKNFVDGQN